jgi:hypothetical protein
MQHMKERAEAEGSLREELERVRNEALEELNSHKEAVSSMRMQQEDLLVLLKVQFSFISLQHINCSMLFLISHCVLRIAGDLEEFFWLDWAYTSQTDANYSCHLECICNTNVSNPDKLPPLNVQDAEKEHQLVSEGLQMKLVHIMCMLLSYVHSERSIL